MEHMAQNVQARPNPKGRSRAVIGLVLFGVFLCFALTICCAVVVVIRSGRNVENVEGVETLHRSPLSHITNDKLTMAAPFPGGRHYLLTSSIFAIDRLFLVDLEEGTVETIRVKKTKFFRFVPIDDGVLVDTGSGTEGKSDPPILLVTVDGAVRYLEQIDINVGMQDNYDRIVDEAARVSKLLEAGELDNLKEIRVISIEREGLSAPRLTAFMNDRYFISINEANERDQPRLRAHATASYTVDNSWLPTPEHPDLEFQIERRPFHLFAGTTDNRSISEVRIYRGDDLVGEYKLKLLYFYALVVGDRLYLVGDSVRYVELGGL